MKRLKDENGQALIITALCMTCLFGFAALATDVGLMLREKRLLQIAADSAAIAGALDLYYYPAGVTAAAQAASAKKGFKDGTNGATVTVHTPPQNGPHQVAGYVEVIISQNQPTLFMNFFGIASMKPTVRAVAQNGGSSYGCVYALAATGTGMSLQGQFNLNAPNCGVIIDSNDPNAALSFTGKAGTIIAGSVGVVGGVSGSSNGTQPVSPIVAQSDPLGYLIPSFPTPPAICPAGGTLTGTISPGCYSGNVTLSNVVLSTGTYVFTGNVTLTGNVTTGPGGATLDLNSGSLTQNTNSTLNLVAPTT